MNQKGATGTEADGTTLKEALAELGSLTEDPVEIHICGASALTMRGIMQGRMSVDIDVIWSSRPLDDLKEAIDAVADKYQLNGTDTLEPWFNWSAASARLYAPEDYRSRLTELEGEFGALKPRCLSPVDIALQKMNAEYTTGGAREQDVGDLEAIPLTVEDRKTIDKELDRISAVNPDMAARMEAKLSVTNPERRRPWKLDDGLENARTVGEICSYAREKLNIDFSEFEKSMRCDVADGRTTLDSLKEMVMQLSQPSKGRVIEEDRGMDL